MESPYRMNKRPLAPKFWYGLSAASLLLWFGLSAATFLLCSCISGGDDSSGANPGTPVGLIQANAAKWKPHAGRSYEIDYGTWSLDGTTTVTCQAIKGVLTGKCLSVYRCCGEDPESTYVDPPYPVPSELLSDFAKRIADFKYEASTVDDSSLTVLKRVAIGADTVRIGYYAVFDRQYGFPTQLVSLGSAAPSAILIKRVEFR
jgi:hypothetical protein